MEIQYRVTVKLQHFNIVMNGPELQVILHKIEDRYGDIKQKITVEAHIGERLISSRVVYSSP
jgi:hypothetical protein